MPHDGHGREIAGGPDGPRSRKLRRTQGGGRMDHVRIQKDGWRRPDHRDPPKRNTRPIELSFPRIRDSRPTPKERPIGKVAEKLLIDYRRQVALWAARSARVPLDLMGGIIGVSRATAARMLAELDETGDPWRGFVVRCLTAMHSGKIPMGRETAHGALADGFYESLGWGDRGRHLIICRVGAASVFDPADLLETLGTQDTAHRDEPIDGKLDSLVIAAVVQAGNYWIRYGHVWNRELCS